MISQKSQKILDRITYILEDKRGVSVFSHGAFVFEIGSSPNPDITETLAKEVSLLLEDENLTTGCKEYLQEKFMKLVEMGLPTSDLIIDLSGLVFALQADNKKDYETDAFLSEAGSGSILDPDAHNVTGLLKWGEDIQSTYYNDDPSESITESCNYLKAISRNRS